VEEIDIGQALRIFPALRPEWVKRAMCKPGVADIDVDALHQGLLRGIREQGGQVHTNTRLTGLAFTDGYWAATCDHRTVNAPVLVNAAGAWADEIAAMAGVDPCELTPLRRTAFLTSAPQGAQINTWPMVNDASDSFYLKPESGRLLVSPADATPCLPGDTRPADLDIAVGIERVNRATTLNIRHVMRAWAGLRTASPDDEPIIGPDRRVEGFFWLAGLGGYGVQTAPEAGRLLAGMVTGTIQVNPALAASRFVI
jgi:D-arginine dehydrogenase